MIVHNLEQGSEAWHAWRKDGITASEIPVIMGISPYMKIDELFLQKIGEAPGLKSNWAMEKGKEMEPRLRAEVELKLGRKFPPLCISHDRWSWAKASLDGYDYGSPMSYTTTLEIKVNGKYNHSLAKNNEIVDHHRAQVQWQMFCAGVESSIYASCDLATGELHTTTINADHEYQQELFVKALAFHENVLSKTPPTEPPPFDLITLLEQYETCSRQAEALEIKMKEIKQKIQNRVDEDKSIAWGAVSAYWKERKGNVDYSKIPSLQAVNLEDYRKPTTKYFEIRVK